MVISVVVPCFNEEESIPLFYREMERVRMKMGEKFEYIFINDVSICIQNETDNSIVLGQRHYFWRRPTNLLL